MWTYLDFVNCVKWSNSSCVSAVRFVPFLDPDDFFEASLHNASEEKRENFANMLQHVVLGWMLVTVDHNRRIGHVSRRIGVCRRIGVQTTELLQILHNLTHAIEYERYALDVWRHFGQLTQRLLHVVGSRGLVYANEARSVSQLINSTGCYLLSETHPVRTPCPSSSTEASWNRCPCNCLRSPLLIRLCPAFSLCPRQDE